MLPSWGSVQRGCQRRRATVNQSHLPLLWASPILFLLALSLEKLLLWFTETALQSLCRKRRDGHRQHSLCACNTSSLLCTCQHTLCDKCALFWQAKTAKNHSRRLCLVRSPQGTRVTRQRTLWCIHPAGNDLTPAMTSVSAEIPRMLSRAVVLKKGLITEAEPSGTNLARFLISRSHRSGKKEHYSLSSLLIGRHTL